MERQSKVDLSLSSVLQRELLAFGAAATGSPAAAPALAAASLALAVDSQELRGTLMTSTHSITDTPERRRQAEVISQHSARSLAVARCSFPQCPGQAERKVALALGRPPAPLQVCSRCMTALYCTPECQRSHWRGEGCEPHKAACSRSASTGEHAISKEQSDFLDAAAFVRVASPTLAALFFVWWRRWQELGLPFIPLLHLQVAPPCGAGPQSCAWRVSPYLPSLYSAQLLRSAPPSRAAHVAAALASAGGRDDPASASFLDASGVAEVATHLMTNPALARYGDALVTGERIFIAVTGPAQDYGLTKWVSLQHCVPMEHLQRRHRALERAARGSSSSSSSDMEAARAMLRATHLLAFPVRQGQAEDAALHAAQTAAQGGFNCDMWLGLLKEQLGEEALEAAIAEGRRPRMVGVLYGDWRAAAAEPKGQ